MSNVSRISWGASMLALGILLPMAFHVVGLGPVFLPMHISVLLAGFLTEAPVAAGVGFATPLISALLTGMPAMVPPVAQGMAFELAVYGTLASLLYRRLHLNVYIALAGSMLGGRVVYGALAALLFPVLGLKSVPFLYPITAGLLSSVPGLVLQLIVVPAIVVVAERSVTSLRRRASVMNTASASSRGGH